MKKEALLKIKIFYYVLYILNKININDGITKKSSFIGLLEVKNPILF
ncbi:hypothetical protein ADICYQ_1537 [Cyclobacterium qasimii M12-11B]|uniref:Uncharacterized protein n=1 Tax=Cyclobacterium qasimii M12-11B TaxID=641524 RepID=S7VGT1_9BACT|nr:hypothetical protein ADICYQ_1537 [Cyclobacterium qasimii M12-11B]